MLQGLLKLRQIFPLLNRVSQKIVLSHRNELITAVACQFIAHCVSQSEVQSQSSSTTPHWRGIVDFALRSSSVIVQESAAEAMAAVSRLVDCNTQVER